MKTAVLSDIHSNYQALKACYEDAAAHGVDNYIFLGDYVSDLAEPQKTMDLLYKIQSMHPCVFLRGNRERYMLECQRGISSFCRGSKSGSILFTFDQLRKQDLDFFHALMISDTITLNGVQIEIAHASRDNDRYYFDCNDGHATEIFGQMKCDYLLTGHSHKQYLKRKNNKTIINPGSVGIPQDGTMWSKYAILEIADGDISCLFRRVPYDLEKTIHAQFENGLMDYAKYWAIGILYDIILGEEWVLRLLQHVENTGETHIEEAWHSAAVKLGMKFTEQEIIELYHQRKSNP